MQTNCLNKKAGNDSPLWFFLPGHQLFNISPSTKGLPAFSKSHETNKTIWGLLGGMATGATLTAAITYLANKRAEKKWDEERKELHETKINAINPIEAPNFAPEKENVKKLRELGLKDTLKLEDKADIKKTAGILVPEAWSTIIPLAGTAAAVAGTYHVMKKDMVDERVKKLDDEILAMRNKLDALYAKELELKGLKKSSSMPKAAGIPGAFNAWWGATLLATLATTGFASYEYTKHMLAANRRKKLLKELAARNTTNIPSTIQVEVPDKLPTKGSEQTYIEDLQNQIEKADKSEK
jgi:hypothetical protein